MTTIQAQMTVTQKGTNIDGSGFVVLTMHENDQQTGQCTMRMTNQPAYDGFVLGQNYTLTFTPDTPTPTPVPPKRPPSRPRRKQSPRKKSSTRRR